MTDPAAAPLELTRQSVLSGAIRAFIRAADPNQPLLGDAEHRAAVGKMLGRRPDGGGDVWLFAYGSLLWNPLVKYRAKTVATARGYHRSFCLWTHLGRGSPGAPGLVLGLEPGGQCRGVAYRIAAAAAARELHLVWRREMVTSVYCPRWVRIAGPAGPGWAIAFVINRAHERYAGRLPEARIVAAIAAATGHLGPCAAYLHQTAAHLAALGIADPQMARLGRLVARAQAGPAGAT